MPFMPMILIVDDEPRFCESLNILLGSHNYEIFTADSGKKAQDLLAKEVFDVVLLDIVMPDMDGLQLMDHIKAMHSDTFVIVITGYATLDSAVSALRKGAFDYIRKPFEYEELLKTIQNALNQKSLKCENDILNGKLLLSDERYRYLVQNSPDIIYTLDERGNFTFINNAAERLIGFEIDRLVGQHYTTIIHEEDLGKARWAFNERRTGDRATSGIELRLIAYSNRDHLEDYEDRHLTIELKATGVYDRSITEKDKKFLGTYGVARDISYRKSIEEQFRQAQKMEAIGTLAGGIAHEFNNALTGITGNIGLLQMDLPDDERYNNYILQMKDSTQRMTQLTNQLLAYARGGKYQPKIMSVSDFVRDTLPILEHTLNPAVNLVTDLPNTISPIKADLTQMQMLLSALLSNANEAIENDGHIRITAGNEDFDEEFTKQHHDLRPGRYVCLTVEDDGKGMSEEVRSRIFEPFFTTKFQGRGMGMAAIYGIVRNHDGWISVDSELGKGTVARIYLPAVKAQEKEKIKPAAEAGKSAATILVIEDEEMMMFVTQNILNRFGYRVLQAKTGKQAVDIAKTFDGEIDIALLDIKLPDMDGDKVYPLIMEARPNLKVVVFSGYVKSGPTQEILNAGAQGFLQKPFTLTELSEKLKEVLEDK